MPTIYRHALVQLRRLDVEDALDAGSSRATRRLYQEGHRVALIHEAQLALLGRAIGRVHEDAAAVQDAGAGASSPAANYIPAAAYPSDLVAPSSNGYVQDQHSGAYYYDPMSDPVVLNALRIANSVTGR